MEQGQTAHPGTAMKNPQRTEAKTLGELKRDGWQARTVKDEMRDEEVLACVVLKREMAEKEVATTLFHHCNERLAYYKPPGWVHIVQSLPTTGTQKIQKHNIYPAGTDPRALPGIIDLRALKRRQRG